MAVAMALTVFAGFARSWFLKSVFHAPPELSVLIAVHGAVFTTWIAILIAQTSLVARNRRDLHRKLGVAGFIVAGLMLILGTMLAIDALHRGFTPAGGPPPTVFFVVPIGDMVAFVPMLALGWMNRSRPDYHKRYMLLATAMLLDAAVARIPIGFIETNALPASVIGADLFIVAMMIYDFATKRRVHPATLWSALIIVVMQAGRGWLGGTQIWHDFAVWVLRTLWESIGCEPSISPIKLWGRADETFFIVPCTARFVRHRNAFRFVGYGAGGRRCLGLSWHGADPRRFI